MSPRFKLPGGGGHVASIVAIECGVCGKTCTISTKAAKGGHLPPEAIEQAYRRKGWLIGSRPAKDRCPDHARTKRNHQDEEAPEMADDPKIIDIRSPAPGASEKPPREMTKTDRRLIIAKLEEVYIDENTGYSVGWNDERVAKDMAVQRAWVELIREENFGPIKAEQSAEVQGIKLAIDESERVLANANRDLTSVLREQAEIAAKQKQLSASIEGVTAILNKARAELARITGAR